MKRYFICAFAFLLFAATASAQTAVTPKDLEDVLKKIAQRQAAVDPASAAKITIHDNQISFEGQPVDAEFGAEPGTIVKQIRIKMPREDYAFSAVLQSPQTYERTVRQVSGVDAVVFFNDNEIFVYTQAMQHGALALNEWIYARKPNGPRGSQWDWILKANAWHWPLTMETGEDGVTKVNRHLPFAGIPIDIKARHQYMLQMMLKFKSGDPVKNYFPFSETVATIPPVRFWTKEGVERRSDVGVLNSTIVDANTLKPAKGLDFNAWNDYWQSVYTVSASAPAEDYPLLIGPQE